MGVSIEHTLSLQVVSMSAGVVSAQRWAHAFGCDWIDKKWLLFGRLAAGMDGLFYLGLKSSLSLFPCSVRRSVGEKTVHSVSLLAFGQGPLLFVPHFKLFSSFLCLPGSFPSEFGKETHTLGVFHFHFGPKVK